MKYFIMNDRNDVNAGYAEVTAEEFTNHQNNEVDGKVYVINLGYAIMEATKENYLSFYKERRRRKYVREETERMGGLLSLNTLDSEEFNGTDVVVDVSEPFENVIERKILIEKLPELISKLNETEREFIYNIYFRNISLREISRTEGIALTNLFNQKARILKKLSKLFEK